MSSPEALDAALAALDEALAAGDHALAARLSEESLARFPDSGEICHARALALLGLGRTDAALEHLFEALRLEPDLADAWLDAAELLIEEVGDELRGLELLREARERLEDPKALAEVAMLRGIALSHLQDLSGALRALEEAETLDPENPEPLLESAAVQIELLRLEEAERRLRRSLELGSEDPRAYQLLAFVLDYTGRREEAADQLTEAARLDPELSGEPVRMSEEEFDAAVEAALLKVPERFARHLENVEISAQNFPDREFCRRHDCGPMTLGLYVGTPMPLRENEARDLPDRIVLFQRSLESACKDRDELVEEIAITLKHEIGHFLGLEEDELHDAGHG
jgi:predicted Zn-dependent protease with MMP-like domain